GSLEARDVDDREHDTIGGALGLVRQDTQEQPVAVEIPNLSLDTGTMLEHLLEVLENSWVVEAMGEAGDRAPHVSCEQVKELGDGGRELADAEVLIEEYRPDVGRSEQVVHVVGELGELRNLVLELCIDGVELLVDGLK